MVPELWVVNATTGEWVKARDTCDPNQVYWSNNRQTHEYEVAVCRCDLPLSLPFACPL